MTWSMHHRSACPALNTDWKGLACKIIGVADGDWPECKRNSCTQVARSGPLTAGAQLQPPPGFFARGPLRMWADMPACSSFALSYSPSGGPVGAPTHLSTLACYFYRAEVFR
jgi:hypothetical protein